MKTYPLQDLAKIQPGYPFRGKLPLSDSGDVCVVQFRHMIVGDRLCDHAGNRLDRAHLTGRKKPNFLRSGDVIFMAKGTRNFAAAIGDIPDNTVCTPNFYHLRIGHEVRDLSPDFLAWQLNYHDAQRYFASCSQGSAAPSITKAQLRELPIMVPPIDRQHQIVSLSKAALHEKQLLGQLIENRQRMIDAVGRQILHPEQGQEYRNE